MLCDSIKVRDPMKVGRFGLGFKSVFHVTGKIPPESANQQQMKQQIVISFVRSVDRSINKPVS